MNIDLTHPHLLSREQLIYVFNEVKSEIAFGC